MPNEKGWFTKQEVLETGLPYYIPRSDRWTDEPYSFAVLLSKTRCKVLGVPILESGRESPSAFRYSAAAGTGTNDNKHRFIPLYDRTDAYHLIKDQLYENEIMGSHK